MINKIFSIFLGPRRIVQIGEKTVDYNDNFRLYICSKNPLLQLDQTSKASVALICFSITQTGLASQVCFQLFFERSQFFCKELAELTYQCIRTSW